MGQPLNGRYASVKIGTTLIQNLGRWSLDIKGTEIDVSAFGSSWGKSLVGMQKWTATVEGMYDPADTTGQKALQDAEIAGTLLQDIRLYQDTTSYWAPASTEDTTAGAYVLGLTVTHDKAGVATVTFNLVGFGKIKMI